MLYSKKEKARAVVISSPAHKDLDDLEVVMHGHEDGWWHEGVYHGTLKVNEKEEGPNYFIIDVCNCRTI